MSDLIRNLRDLAAFAHADLSVADEAADEIERLRIDLEVEGGRRVKAQLFQNDMLKEIERLRKALQLIAAPSKVVVKGEEAVVALRLVLSSHRRTALKALGEK